MEIVQLLTILQEFAYILATFVFFLAIGLWKGHYYLVKCLIAFYLSLLLIIKFPYFEVIANTLGSKVILLKIVAFIILTIAGIFLLRRHIPSDDYEKMFEGFTKKIILAMLATMLIFAFGYETLNISELMSPSSLLQHVFVENNHFFWWLLVPLIVLSFL